MKRTTLAAEVTDQLLQMIRNGDFQPGKLLPSQKEMASRLGVSSGTMREALQALTAMGIVESQSGKGTWICPDAYGSLVSASVVKARLGTMDAFRVYEARSAIEVALTELAAKHATDEDIAKIWDAQYALEGVLDDVDAFINADLEFHLAVADASHNDLLRQFYYLSRKLVIDIVSELVQVRQVRIDSERLQRTIAETIEAHAIAEAREAALLHMKYIEPYFLETTDSPK
jgi:GntR family transcriptional repressor for pyruvate dehydrogenase complex